MNPRQELVQLLLSEPEAAAECAARLSRSGAWQPIFSQADAWNVVPNLRQRLLNLVVELPSPVQKQLFLLFQRAFATATLQARRGVHLCRTLEDRGIPVVVFKGLASIAHLYGGNPSGRMIKDTDVLIRLQDLHHAVDVLREIGLAPEDGGNLADFLVFVRNSPGFAGNEALTVRGEGLGDLDIHWSLGPSTSQHFSVDAIFERAEMLSVLDTEVRVAAPVDGLMFSAHHSVREGFSPEQMLRDVLDASRWLDLLERNSAIPDALLHARRCRLETPVLALVEILKRVSGRESIGVPNRQATQLADLFQLQVSEGSIGKDIRHLGDTHVVLQILRGVLSGWNRYSMQMAAFETQLTGKPLPLWDRMRMGVRQLRQLDRRRWQMVRTLAKTKAAYQRGG